MPETLQPSPGQVPVWEQPQTDLNDAVLEARGVTGANEDGTLRINSEGTFIGDSVRMGAPTLLVDGHSNRVDARQGATDGSEQTHVWVNPNNGTGEVEGGGTVSGVDSDGKGYERRVNTAEAQHLATVIARNVTRAAKESQASSAEQPDRSGLS